MVCLAPLFRDASPGPLVAPVSSDTGGRVIEAVVDSGAEDSVAPPGLFSEPVVPSPMSRAGRSYRAANGSAIPNLGQTVAHFRDPDGRLCGIPFQIAQVERPLIGVSRLTAAGCQVTFQGDVGEILHVASGRRLPLTRRNGVYVLELRVQSMGSPGFHRQG